MRKKSKAIDGDEFPALITTTSPPADPTGTGDPNAE
jgi:hypothetical protein